MLAIHKCSDQTNFKKVQFLEVEVALIDSMSDLSIVSHATYDLWLKAEPFKLEFKNFSN